MLHREAKAVESVYASYLWLPHAAFLAELGALVRWTRLSFVFRLYLRKRYTLPITRRTVPCTLRRAPSQPPPIGHAPVENARVASMATCLGP